jgi:hypothetical protein
MNRSEFIAKQEDLISKFSPEFKEKIMTDAMTRRVFDGLVHGMSPYQLLEQVLDIRLSLQNKLEDVITKQSGSARIIVGKQ